MYFIPWSDAFLLAKTAVETLHWLPLATLDKPRKKDVNNLEAIARKLIFSTKIKYFKDFCNMAAGQNETLDSHGGRGTRFCRVSKLY